MKNSGFKILALAAIVAAMPGASSAAQSDSASREYNVWYQSSGVMYDLTQTADSEPVLVSIFGIGTDDANLVVSQSVPGDCETPAGNATLLVDDKPLNTHYTCFETDKRKKEHFLLSDSREVNSIARKLSQDRTVIINGDIKLWAANFNHPRYGVTPKM
ncbi:hypothetical protein [Entomohabitans teleogrylli]|uniref:hypothetical protein n=1 Tax=Entomohabitans teleogrylli TaxID=1384589 RepID=UPI00073D6E28|nr:hypothetical protein [Entomohabitans teleogrylli]